MELISDEEHAVVMAQEEEMSRLLWATLEKLKKKERGTRRMAQG